MSFSLGRAIAALAATLLISRTIPAQASKPQTQGKPARQFAEGTWQVVREIGIDDDMFDNPGRMTADANRVVVFDFGSNVVKSVRLDGRLEWKSGAKGRGPGEFTTAASVRIDGDGRVIVLDPAAGRITVLDRNGKLVSTVPLTRRFEAGLPARSTSEFLLVNTESDTMVAIGDSLGVPRPMTMLPAEFRSAGPITRELTGSATTSRGQLLAFRWTSRMLLVGPDGKLVRSCSAIDSLSLPPMRKTRLTVQKTEIEYSRVDAAAKEAAQSITILGNRVAVLRPGLSTTRQKTIDLYAADCGRYVESRALPVRTTSIAGSADLLVALVDDPVPHLTVLRWVPATR